MLRGREARVSQTVGRAGTPKGPLRLSGWTHNVRPAGAEAADASGLRKREARTGRRAAAAEGHPRLPGLSPCGGLPGPALTCNAAPRASEQRTTARRPGTSTYGDAVAGSRGQVDVVGVCGDAAVSPGDVGRHVLTDAVHTLAGTVSSCRATHTAVTRDRVSLGLCMGRGAGSVGPSSSYSKLWNCGKLLGHPPGLHHPPVIPPTYAPAHPSVRPPTYPPTHPAICSPTHPPSHSLTHSLPTLRSPTTNYVEHSLGLGSTPGGPALLGFLCVL